MEKFRVKTTERNCLVDITRNVQTIITNKKIKDGILHIYCPHTTAAITVNENCDPSVQTDITNALNKLIPHRAGYSHSEGNADAHIKASIVGSSRTLLIDKGQIAFGTWQGVYLCEFDGPRNREVWVKIIKE